MEHWVSLYEIPSTGIPQISPRHLPRLLRPTFPHFHEIFDIIYIITYMETGFPTFKKVTDNIHDIFITSVNSIFFPNFPGFLDLWDPVTPALIFFMEHRQLFFFFFKFDAELILKERHKNLRCFNDLDQVF